MAEPTLVGDLHLDEPIYPLAGSEWQQRARLLVRLHSRPVGEVVLELRDGGISARGLAAATWDQLAGPIREHVAADGLEPPAGLPLDGLPAVAHPRCLASRADAPPFTVVIATRNRPDSLIRCLFSLAALEHPHFDVVVVDSAPSSADAEHALEVVPKWPFQLRYVRTDRPGLAIAHNAALSSVTEDLVAFTDDDVQVDRHWLSALGEGFAEASVQCVTGLILPAELETPAQLWIEEAGGFARGFADQDFGIDLPSADPLFPFAAGRFGSGANMAFRTEWLRANGGFDPATGAGTPARGGDDLVAFLQVILDGGRLAYRPAAIVRHWHRREYDALRRQAFWYGVGLGAYLTAAAHAHPNLVPAMFARTVPAARHLLSGRSAKNIGKRADYPAELTWRERAGVIAGPFAYATSRRRMRT